MFSILSRRSLAAGAACVRRAPLAGAHAAARRHASAGALRTLPTVVGTAENLADYGQVISGIEATNPGLGIPFYPTVVEGSNMKFECNPPAVVRTAKISPRDDPSVAWLERHMDMTQLFIGLGNQPFVMVLGKPHNDQKLPDLDDVKAFVMPPGHGIIIRKGTWHDFPVAIFGGKPIVCFTMNSAEVVEALASMDAPGEMDFGDVYKIAVQKRTGVMAKMEPAAIFAAGEEAKKVVQ